MNLKIKNHRLSRKLSRNICKVSVTKILSYKRVKKSIDKKNKNKIPITYITNWKKKQSL